MGGKIFEEKLFIIDNPINVSSIDWIETAVTSLFMLRFSNRLLHRKLVVFPMMCLTQVLNILTKWLILSVHRTIVFIKLKLTIETFLLSLFNSKAFFQLEGLFFY
jgi:hypothetical protein